MIRYDLTCEKDHQFDGWFASAAGFDRLLAAGQVTCVVCGSAQVSKMLMAPAVASGLTAPRNTAEQALAALRAKVEAESEYVGLNFATEARAIHAGDAPERAIYGEAKFEEAKALIEDGVPVAPLPFTPTRKAN
ncbi:MAG: hypothetical protein RLZZ437_2583 [Pseudomonadota bacterium]|jgi:hypothetical protein